MFKHNPQVVALLQSGPFAIDWQYAIEAWSNYLEELTLLEAGVPYADLGICARRAETFPAVISMESGRPIVVQDSAMLRDERETPRDSYALLRLQGVMRSQDGASSRGVLSVIDDLNAAIANPNIKGIVLEVNSGGGQAIAGQMMHTAISSSPKPVVAFAHMAGSAAYMAAMAADKVVASNNAARVGSIGTMMTLPKGFASWYNTNYQDEYASASTNKNSAFRAFLQGDMSKLREELEETNEQFLAAVRENRELKGGSSYQKHTLSGAMFQAREAKRRGLIDSIGGLDTAISQLEKLLA
jgi:ClpP class serine protease